MKAYRFYIVACLIVASLALGACSGMSTAKVDIAAIDSDLILTPDGVGTLDPARVSEILSTIRERNTTVEDDPEWIKRAYSQLMIRRLTNVSENEFPSYRQYLDNGSAYIIVHPVFFSFFHYPKKLRDNTKKKFYPENVVELLLKLSPPDPQFAVLQAQERRMRDFLEFKSTEEKLLIVIVPKNYQEYTGYTYRKGLDEYMRFINETTNFSPSVLYIESRSPNRGYLTDNDAERLMEFLLSINAKNIYIGGGYVGRCLEDFYSYLTEEYGTEGIYVVPELADISPREISLSIARSVLKPDGLISKPIATQLMQQDIYQVQEIKTQIMNLP